MALTERSRSAIYQGFTAIIDEEAVQEMLSYFPARDVEESVTREFLRAETTTLGSELRAEMADLGSELRAEMADLGSELRAEMGAVESRLQSELHASLTDLRQELHHSLRQQTQWMLAMMVTLVALMVSIQTFIR